jgi:tetratricopeptide (TPR) repeat protein
MKYFRLNFASFLFGLILIFVSPLYADTQIFERTVRQVFGGSQSPDDARIGAIAKAKREVLEEAGTYLESLSIVKNGVLESDSILAMSSAIFNVEIVSQKNFSTDDSFGIIVKTRIKVDTSTLEQRIKDLSKDKEKQYKYKDLENKNSELLARLEKLEAENRYLIDNPFENNAAVSKRIKRDFKTVSNSLSAYEWNDKALKLLINNKYVNPLKAIDYLNKAIYVDSKVSYSYYHRGIAYGDLKKYKRAIQDYDKAIELDNKYGTRSPQISLVNNS